MKQVGVVATGIKLPLVTPGINLVDLIVEKAINFNLWEYQDDIPIIGITESVVARSQSNYVTIDEIAEEIEHLFGQNSTIIIDKPIYSRNRFSMILKAIARVAQKIYFVAPDFDEVGNPLEVNVRTGVNIKDYYTSICDSEFCNAEFYSRLEDIPDYSEYPRIYCGLHDYIGYPCSKKLITLRDICNDKCEYGLLGSNKATDESLKLFPNVTKAQELCETISEKLFQKTGKHCIVCVYGDGCFKDPVTGIWEFADPVTMPAFTHKNILLSAPNEVKLKYLIDTERNNCSESDLNKKIINTVNGAKESDLYNRMSSQGTTPRLRRDLLASLMDLVSGSGDKGTPVVFIQNYFNKYCD